MTAVEQAETFAREWARWHEQHEARRADRHGFLAITSLHWLAADPQTFPDAPGAWSSGPDGIVVELGAHQLVVGGEPVTGRHVFGVLAERASVFAGWDDAVIEVAKRGGHDIVRPRHPGAERLAAYPGTPAYPADPAWAVSGRYVPFDVPRPTTVGAVVDELQHVYDAPGEIHVRLAGEDVALTAFPAAGDSLMVLFTDATSGVTTYAANRVLSVSRPTAENQLSVAVEAGEKAPAA